MIVRWESINSIISKREPWREIGLPGFGYTSKLAFAVYTNKVSISPSSKTPKIFEITHFGTENNPTDGIEQ